jgi:hypothetical protein
VSDFSTIVGPVIFRGGQPAEYAVEVLKNGGLGTRHLPTQSIVPHVLSKVSSETLSEGVPVPGGSRLVQLARQSGSQAAQALQVGLQVANLGVGLLNLGVSAWTAWKIHKIDKKIDVLSDGVVRLDGKVDQLRYLLDDSVLHLDGLIRENALMLGFIVEHQAHLEHGLALLRRELAQGFRSVHEALSSAEGRREAQELEHQMRTLFRYYEVCSREMQAGRTPPSADLRQIVDAGTRLVAWLDTRLSALPSGRAERLPLLVARAFALRLETESRDVLGEAPGGRNAEFDRFRALIRQELDAIIEGVPLCALAEGRHALIEQYIYLHRALRGSATMLELGDGHVVPLYPAAMLQWDDGLDRVRELAAVRTGSPPLRLELRTLEEHNAWRRVAGLPRGASDDEVDRDELARVLGLPIEDCPPEENLRELLRAAPAASAELRARIKNEVE